MKLLRMRVESLLSGLCVLITILSTTSCLLVPDSGSDQDTVVDVEPETSVPDPDTFSCNQFGGVTEGLAREQGVRGQLYYLNSTQPHYTRVTDYFTYGIFAQGIDNMTGLATNIVLYFNQIFVPTRPFDRGFTMQSGHTLQTEEGNTLYEYFAIRHEGRLQLGSKPSGLYQLAILSDDGSVLNMDFGNGYQTVIDNDGNHPTRFGCANAAVQIGSDEKIPYILDYYQGPRYHIALILMWRPWPMSVTDPTQPASVAEANDAFCGVYGNSFYFNSNTNPPTPSANYNALLSRGWEPVAPENYLLPSAGQTNPCNEPAPVITNFQVVAIASTSVTLSWTTDIAATSQVIYRLASGVTEATTPETGQYYTSHSITVTGLSSNTDYVVRAHSASSSGLSADSAPLTVRTRR